MLNGAGLCGKRVSLKSESGTYSYNNLFSLSAADLQIIAVMEAIEKLHNPSGNFKVTITNLYRVHPW